MLATLNTGDVCANTDAVTFAAYLHRWTGKESALLTTFVADVEGTLKSVRCPQFAETLMSLMYIRHMYMGPLPRMGIGGRLDVWFVDSTVTDPSISTR